MRSFIKNTVFNLIKKHNTNNPFEIASAENIIIIKEPLGSIYGYYNKKYRQQFIHINCDIDELKQYTTCCHELGHAIIHPNSNTPFLRSNTFCSINKLEKQANLFAAELIIKDDLIINYKGYNLEHISLVENIPIELLKLKFENI